LRPQTKKYERAITMANKDYTYSQVKNAASGSGIYYQKETSPQYSSGVETLQSRLPSCGYDIAVDGLFGSGTDTVVKAFQTECGLSVDGKAGKGTLTQLDLVYDSKYFKDYGKPITSSSWGRSHILSGACDDIDMLSRSIWVEDRGNLDAQIAVAKVIQNRSNSTSSSFIASASSNPNASKWARVIAYSGQYACAASSDAYAPKRGDASKSDGVCAETIRQIILRYRDQRRYADISLNTGKTGIFEDEYRSDADLLFLDIDSKPVSGLSIAQGLRQASDRVMILLVAASPSFALEGYALRALNYYIRPIHCRMVEQDLDYAYAVTASRSGLRWLYIRNADTAFRIFFDDIITIETSKRKLQINTIWRSVLCSLTLTYLSGILDGSFYRVHDSYIVNMNRIIAVDQEEILLHNNHTAYISRQRKGGIKKCLIFVVIGLAFALDNTLLVDRPMLKGLSTGYYIVSETLSILENIGECGIPIPRALKQILEKMNSDEKPKNPPENGAK
jgi:DNA-binding LytR/AlgR family response regulator/peptidoglycan hydrolase-like protein with peptidoglycan-binding domain